MSTTQINDLASGEIIVEYSASVLAPWDEFATTMTNFPGLNAQSPWGEHGNFYVCFKLYANGKKIGEISSAMYTEKDVICVELDQLLRHVKCQGFGLIVLEYYHSKDIPVAGYLSLIHRKTGTYAPLPVLAYMGDQIYPDAHANALENSMFWPGMATDSRTSHQMAIVNPFQQTFLYQLHFFNQDGKRVQTQTKKLQARSTTLHIIEEEFSAEVDEVKDQHGSCSICVSAQHKVLPLMIMTDKKTGIITGVDHLHPYSLV